MCKKTILTFLVMVSLFCGMAQTTMPANTVTQPFTRHEWRIGIGTPFIAGLYTANYLYETGYGAIWARNEEAGYWLGDDIYHGPTTILPPLSVSYHYYVKKWCAIGVTVSYAGFYSTVLDRATNEKLGSSDEHLVSIMPTVHFQWFNRKSVSLYSGLALGYTFCVNPYYDPMLHKRQSFTNHYCGFQATAIGIKAGKQWYGFAELGIGVQGCISAGFGYRFHDKSINYQHHQ